MHIIDTQVANHGDGKITVEFVGEGGESIVVKLLSATGDLDGDAAVTHAKEMMTQVAAFGAIDPAASDEADTENGEHSPVSVGSFSDPNTV